MSIMTEKWVQDHPHETTTAWTSLFKAAKKRKRKVLPNERQEKAAQPRPTHMTHDSFAAEEVLNQY